MKFLELFQHLIASLKSPFVDKYAECIVLIPRTETSTQEFMKQLAEIHSKKLDWIKAVWEKLHEDQIIHLLNTTYDIIPLPEVRSRDFTTAMVLHPNKRTIGYLIQINGRFLFLDELQAQKLLQEWDLPWREFV